MFYCQGFQVHARSLTRWSVVGSQIVCEEPCSEEALPRKKNLQVRIGQRASRVLAPVQEATLCQFCQFGCCQVLHDIVGRAL